MVCTKVTLLHRRKAPPQLVRSASKDTSNVSSVETPRECYEPENKWKCTEPERMSDDLMELNITELNYIYFETDSDNTNIKSKEDFLL